MLRYLSSLLALVLMAGVACADDYPSASGALNSIGVVPQVLNGQGKATAVGTSYPLATGGVTLSSSFTPTITASSAYASGYCLGPVMTFSNVARADGPGTGYVLKATITDAAAQNAPADLVLLNSLPTGTYTDHTACSIAAGDLAKEAAVIHISDCTAGANLCQATALGGINFNLGAGNTTLYGVAIVRGTPTYTGASNVTFKLGTSSD